MTDVRYGGAAGNYLLLKAGIAWLEAFGMVPRAESNLPTPPFSSAALYRVSYLGACPTQGWRAREDDFRTFLGDFVVALPQITFPAGLAP
jgi:hypothetical protein